MTEAISLNQSLKKSFIDKHYNPEINVVKYEDYFKELITVSN